ncbi:unnamed protein product [Schistosoma curassoni]|uniref:Uncharacterized protein n=1 Tax=Schistosoma curassoni TaxID=6186 RepID=A0A183L531_9TREM|nr:unnamed protein product [Schistosoma curassoni]
MVVGGSRQKTLDPGFVLLGTRQQCVPVILRELVLPSRFDPKKHETPVQGFLSTISSHHLISIYSARSVESP